MTPHLHSESGSKPIGLIVLTALLALCAVFALLQWRTATALKQENLALRAASEDAQRLREENAQLEQLRSEAKEAERLRADSQELLRLRNEVRQLRQQTGEMEKLRAENLRLQNNLKDQAAAARTASAQAAAVVVASEDARRKAESLACVNNLKQVGLAGRMWANDHNAVMPPDFQTMKGELGAPRVLICPGDTAKSHLFDTNGNPLPALMDWASFDVRTISYQMVSPNVAVNAAPETVFARCPVHGHECHIDGSVTHGPAQK
jgi:hypothetical protein